MSTQTTSIPAAQAALLQIASELQTLDARLISLALSIEPKLGSSLPGELRDGIRCVRTDLLHDAIETLRTLGNATESRVLSRRLEIDAAAQLTAAFG